MGHRCIFIDCPNSGDKKVPFEKIHAFPAVGGGQVFLQDESAVEGTVLELDD
jgi:hypothetical protein